MSVPALAEVGKPEEYKSGLTKRVIIISIIVIPIYYLATQFLWNLSGKPYTFSGGFISFFWIVLVSEFLGRVNAKLRLTKQELVLLYVPFWLITGISFLEKGTPNEGLVKGTCSATGLIPAIFAMCSASYDTSTAWKGLFPSFWVPPDTDIVALAWNGLRPGQVMDWGPWLGPLAYWILWWIAWVIIGLCWGFILRKPLVEIERLPFVAGLPIAYFTAVAAEVDPATNKSRIFNLRDPWNRIFWIGFIIGIIASIIPISAEIFPFVPWGEWWGEIPIDLTPYTEPALPGLDVSFVLHVSQIMLWTLVPMDILVSGVVSWIAFQVIYNIAVIKMGLIPFEPGISAWTSWGIGWRPPFHYAWFGAVGIMAGIGIWTFVNAWSYIKKAFATLTGPDFEDQGQSMRSVVILLIIFTIIWWVLWAAAGAPVWEFIIFFIFWTIWIFGSTRIVAEAWYHHPIGTQLCFPFLYYPGAAAGLWPWGPPNTEAGAVVTMFQNATATFWTPRFQSNAMFMAEIGYKVADINRTRAGDLFKWLVIVSIISIIIALPIDLWFQHHFGGLASFTGDNWEADGVVWAAQGSNLQSSEFFPEAYGFEHHVAYTIGGIILTFLFYLARIRWAWFLINPVGLCIGMWLAEYMWFNSLAALILKLVITRVGGVEALERRWLPFVVGFCVGFGVLFIVMAIREYIVAVITKAVAVYVP